MATTEQFSLRWNNFHSNLTSGFHELLEAAEMVDVTLAVDGHFIQAHKIVLSICSPYFRQMFKCSPCKHPIVILKDVAHENIKDILEFMYMGEVNVLRENLSSFLRTAELLQVKGLTGDDSSETSSRKDEKSDSFAGDEQDLLEFNQLIDSDVELPPYPTPRISPPPQPQLQQRQSPSPQPLLQQPQQHTVGSSKRQRNPHNNPILKRPKSETSNQSKLMKTESDSIKEEAEYVETSFSSQERTSNSLEQNLENKDLRPGILENSSAGISLPDNLLVDQGRQNKNSYQCEKCSKKFSRRDHLRTHEKNIHGEDAGPFVCVICSQLYKNTESLRKHIAKFHFPKINEVHNSKVELKA